MNIRKKTAVLLSLIFVLSMTAAAGAAFTDIEGHQYKAAIEYCKEHGFVKGTSATTFDPDAKLTRAQFATVWSRVMQFDDTNHSFNDVTRLKNYYDTSMIILHSKGILNGTGVNTASPEQYITREQLALIAKRTHSLGVDNNNDYTRYGDSSSISTWARDGVSACINAGVFVGLYDGANFLPTKAVTRAEICKLIYNINSEKFDITIASMEGGTVTANMPSARAGTTIILDVNPDTDMRLVDGSLKYNGTAITGTAFTMPANDVTITAEFEAIPEPSPEVTPVLESIEIKQQPTKITYTVGETLDLTGLVITAKYDNATEDDVTEGFTTDPAGGSVLNTEGSVTITVSNTEDGVTKTADFSVTVNAQS